MRQAPLAIGLETPSRKDSKAGSLTGTMSAASILIAITSLALALRGAVISGDYRMIVSHQSLTPFITTGFAVLGALIASRCPRNSIGWIYLSIGLLYAITSLSAAVLANTSPSTSFYAVAYWLGSWSWIPALFLPITYVLLIFPEGHLLSPRWRTIAWAVALGLLLAVLAVMLNPGLVEKGVVYPNPFKTLPYAHLLDKLTYFVSALMAVGFFGSLAAFIVRFRRSQGVEREQMKWLLYALGLTLFLMTMSSITLAIWPNVPWMTEINIVASDLGILGIAIATAIAILRHGLYDIDLIINRTFVYAALTVGVAGLYGLVVGTLGALFRSGSSWFISLLATGMAAILVQPMRDRMQRLVNHLIYGERDDPYAVLSRLSRRLEGSKSPEATLPAVVETVAQTLKLPYVAIALKQEGNFTIAASYGLAGDDGIQLPLIFHGETIGQLRLCTRSSKETFTPGEQRLLRDIARHIGVTAHSVLLTQDLRELAEDLQRSREALVKSREEERRRLRRDLHDELGPQLASLKLNLDVARNLVSRDPKAAEALLVELRSHTQAVIVDIRRLAYDLRPPALDELGLIGAIQEYTRQIENRDGLKIRLDSPKDLAPLPAAVEVAAYRITLEALTNFVRHSQGSNCHVSISLIERSLQVDVCDDGVGLPDEVRQGVGLNSMRERASELGGTCIIATLPQGGTRVLARLPLV